jgi:outer membrane lipoprotein LolB
LIRKVLRRRFLWTLACTLAVLSGCASVAPLPAGVRSYADDLTLAGRLSLRYPVQGKTQSVQGKFQWSQHRDTTDIELYSPLGQTIARISIAPGLATLEQSGGVRRAAASPDALTEDALGWPLPVDGMRYWLQGFVRGTDGQLQAAMPEGTERLDSDGWQLSYPVWQPSGDVAVPKRVDAVRGDIALRIVIDDWHSGH